MRNPRIAVYGIGQYGQAIVRMVTEKGWNIVAAFNREGAKVGQDVGRLSGLERDLGVKVQDCEIANYDDLEADVGVVTMTNFLEQNLPAYRRLLGAGLNVLCHGAQSYFPFGTNPQVAREIDELARRHGVTFTGSGIWDMSRIWTGIVLAGPCTRIHSIFHRSITDATMQASSKEQLFQLGAGLTPKEFESRGFTRNPIALAYKTVPEQVLTALGYTISNTRAFVEPVINNEAFDLPFWGGTVDAGICLGWKTIGEVETVQGVTGRCETEVRMVRPAEIEHTYWSIEGSPRNRSTTERMDSGHATVACLFNRIPDVIAAPAGLVELWKLGPLKPSPLL